MSVSVAGITSGDQLSLEIPLGAAHILTARLFAGGVARTLELGEETADVLRLTLTEICSEAVERRRAGRIIIAVSTDTVPIRVSVAAIGALDDEAHTDSTEATYRKTLIDALVPGAIIVEERDRLTVAFTV
ncbi:MAG: hypothetical protein ACRDH7_10625 [Actinomycetota bacterium]